MLDCEAQLVRYRCVLPSASCDRGEKWEEEQLQRTELLHEALSSLVLCYLHLLPCYSLSSAVQLFG